MSYTGKRGPKDLKLDSSTVSKPEILLRSAAERRLEYALYLPADLIYFMGHFPGKPILPGVTQIDWAISLAKPLFAIGGVKSLERIKFMRPIRPCSRISLLLKLTEDTPCLSYRFFDNYGDYSSGKIVFS